MKRSCREFNRLLLERHYETAEQRERESPDQDEVVSNTMSASSYSNSHKRESWEKEAMLMSAAERKRGRQSSVSCRNAVMKTECGGGV